MDETGKTFDDYGVRAFPTTYVINKKGFLEGYVSGAITADQLKKAINENFKEIVILKRSFTASFYILLLILKKSKK